MMVSSIMRDTLLVTVTSDRWMTLEGLTQELLKLGTAIESLECIHDYNEEKQMSFYVGLLLGCFIGGLCGLAIATIMYEEEREGKL